MVVNQLNIKKAFMKIRFESDDVLPLDKILNIIDMIIVVRSVLREDNNNYPQIYLHECAYEIVNEL